MYQRIDGDGKCNKSYALTHMQQQKRQKIQNT